MLEQITLRDLREKFIELDPDTVQVQAPVLNPITFARVETAPRTSVAVER